MAPKSILVVGGGMVGVACAFRLQRAGFRVTLVDHGDWRRGASFGNIGHIATEQVEPLASIESLVRFPSKLFLFGGPLDFRWQDFALWMPWALRFAVSSRPSQFRAGVCALSALQQESLAAWRRLACDVCEPELLVENGHVVLWLDPKAAARRLTFWRKARVGTTRFRELEQSELAHYGSYMARVPAGGIRFFGSGQFKDPQLVRDTVRSKFVSEGGSYVESNVVDVRSTASQTAAVTHTGIELNADLLLITCGARSRSLFRSFGLDVPLIGERGYSVHTTQFDWPDAFPPTVFEERSMVVTKFSTGLRASSFLEFGDPEAPGDARKWRWLERQLKELGIQIGPSADRWVGARPTLPDYLPAIGALRGCPRVFYAFGHQHLGMTLSAVTAELIEALALGAPPKLDLSTFAVERFA